MCLHWIYSSLSVGETKLLFPCCPRQLCYVFYSHHTVEQVLSFTPAVSSFLETDSMHNCLNQLLGTTWNKCKVITLNLSLWIYFLLLCSFFFFNFTKTVFIWEDTPILKKNRKKAEGGFGFFLSMSSLVKKSKIESCIVKAAFLVLGKNDVSSAL